MESGRTAHPTLGPGTVLRDKWRLDSLLARGAMSQVYAATHRNSRRFAIKVLDPRIAADPARLELAIKHAYLANAIPHEGVIHTLDDDITPVGVAFTVMDLVDGETLFSRWQREGRRLRPSHVVDLVLGVLEIFASAHQRQVVHGALSLEHVLIARSGKLRMCGFGSASSPKLAEAASTLAIDFGNAAFVAPEQALVPGAAGPKSDVYAVAAMAFALLKGTLVLDRAEAPFRAGLPHFAAPLAAVLDRAMAFEPSARWPSAMAMREALSDATSDAVRVKTGPQDVFVPSGQSPESARASGDLASGALGSSPSLVVASGSNGSEARRGTTLAVITGLDSGSVAELQARAEAAGLRIEIVLPACALVLPPPLASGRDEAHEMAAFVLAFTHGRPELPISLVTDVDLLVRRPDQQGVLERALFRTPSPGVSAQIRLDAASARLVERMFEVVSDPSGPVLVGERAPLFAFRQLLGRPTAFVGRGQDIAELTELFTACVAREVAHTGLVVAHPGLGKSRLLEEVVARIRENHPEVEVWSVASDPMRRDAAFGVASQIVGCASGATRDDSPEQRRGAIARRVAQELGSPGSEPLARDVARVSEFLAELCGAGFAEQASAEVQSARRDATSMGDQMRFAFLDFMNAVLVRRPLCIVVEDLQWADAASVELLGHAMSLLRSKRWAILATARPEVDEAFPRLWATTRRTLGALDRGALESIARTALGAGSTITSSDAAIAIDLSAGNPLHLEEILRSRAEGTQLPIPSEGLSAVVLRRVTALEPELREVLSAASIFGGTFSLAGVTALLASSPESRAREPAPSELAASLEALCERELVVVRQRHRGGAEYAFRHALVREIAYAALVQRDRATAHGTAARFLEREGAEGAAVLAEHFARGNAEAEAAAWYERSAAEALARSDVPRALALAERGLAYGPREEVALPLSCIKAECHLWRAEYQGARAEANNVLKRTTRGSPLWCRALGSLAPSVTRGGDPEGAVALAEQLLTDFPVAADKRSLAEALRSLVAYLLRLGRPELVRALMARLGALGAEGDAEAATIAFVESARSWCAMFAGDFSECLRHDREVVKRFHEAGDLRNACKETTSIGYDLMVLGSYEDAETAFRTALATAERLGIVTVVLSAKHHLALVSLRLGRLDDAHRLAIEALELGRSSLDPFALGSLRLYLGIILAARGDELGAGRVLEEAIDSFALTPSGQAWPAAELARVRHAQGRIEEALSRAEAAMAVVAATGPSEEGDAVIRLTYVELLVATGRTVEARTAVERALRRLEERSGRISNAILKESFLHRVPEHARTIEAARSLGVIS